MNLNLRPVEFGDLEFIRRNRNNPKLMDKFRQNMPINEQDQLKWFEKISSSAENFIFVIEDIDSLEDNSDWEIPCFKRLGYCALNNIDWIHRKSEFSIWVSPEHSGKGYGKESLKKLIDFGFYNLNLNRIYACVFKSNKALELYKKLGFKEEGIEKEGYYKNGQYIDAHYIGLTRKEWDSNLQTILSQVSDSNKEQW